MRLEDVEVELQRAPLKPGEVGILVIKSDDITMEDVQRIRQRFNQQVEALGHRDQVLVFGCGVDDSVELKSVPVRDGDVLVATLKVDEVVLDCKTVGEIVAEFGLKASVPDPGRYPHRCERCGAPAYVGFTATECSAKCR